MLRTAVALSPFDPAHARPRWMPLSESIPAIILTSAIDRVNAAGVQPICSMSSICDGANAGAIPFRRSFWVVIEAGGVEMVFIWFHKLS
jgi:hypothetical protein